MSSNEQHRGSLFGNTDQIALRSINVTVTVTPQPESSLRRQVVRAISQIVRIVIPGLTGLCPSPPSVRTDDRRYQHRLSGWGEAPLSICTEDLRLR